MGSTVARRSPDAARTVTSYFHSYAPAPAWDELPAWPPDVFALSNLILDHTQGYRFVVAPPAWGRWPPAPDWNQRVLAAAREWSRSADEPGAPLPSLVERCWETLTSARNTPLEEITSGSAWDACEALLTLHATADEACSWLAAPAQPGGCRSCEERAWHLLETHGSLSRVAPTRVRIVPKGHFTTRGITIRSLSRYLALCYKSVDVRWHRVGSDQGVQAALAGRDEYNVLLIPWPLSVRAEDFRPVPTPLGNMDSTVFGFFEFAPKRSLDVRHVRALLDVAQRELGQIDAAILPEASLVPEEVAPLEEALAERGTTFLVGGVRVPPATGAFGRNYLHFSVRAAGGWERHEQDKHHRWCLDGGQIGQYHLTRSLDPRKLWWEAVDIGTKSINVIDFGGGSTTAPLVCEDLARMDEVADLLRAIGPTVVIAVLMDGPQLVSRWPCRYACVLSQEPGSGVLTLTSFGMAARSRPKGMRHSRVIALWTSSQGVQREIELARGAQAVGVTLSVGLKTVWTADGRRHADVPDMTLSGVRQLRI